MDELAIDRHATLARVTGDKARQMAQQGGFARARCAQQGHHFAVGDLQADVVQRFGAGMERLAQGLYFDGVRHRLIPLDVVIAAFCFERMTAR